MAASGSRLSEVLSTKGPLSSCSSGFECKGLSLTIGPTLYSFPYSPPVPRPCHFLNRLSAFRSRNGVSTELLQLSLRSLGLHSGVGTIRERLGLFRPPGLWRHAGAHGTAPRRA